MSGDDLAAVLRTQERFSPTNVFDLGSIEVNTSSVDFNTRWLVDIDGIQVGLQLNKEWYT